MDNVDNTMPPMSEQFCDMLSVELMEVDQVIMQMVLLEEVESRRGNTTSNNK